MIVHKDSLYLLCKLMHIEKCITGEFNLSSLKNSSENADDARILQMSMCSKRLI